jgi:hypothetical protein
MQKDLAKELMDTLSALDEPLNKAAELIEQIDDEEERKKFRKGLGSIMAGVYTELELLIIQQYPNLDPDKR